MTADALVPVTEGLPAPPGLFETLERAAGYARAARADNTRRAYRAAWADFAAWCRERGLADLPAAPETVGAFLAERAATCKPASLHLRLVAVRQAHRLAGHELRADHPAVRDVMQGIRRSQDQRRSHRGTCMAPSVSMRLGCVRRGCRRGECWD